MESEPALLLDHQGRPLPASSTGSAARLQLGRRALAGGRVSMDAPDEAMATALLLGAPDSPQAQWRTENLDSKSLDKRDPGQLLEMMVDISPDISRAVWDFLRFCNPGWEVFAYQPGTEAEEPEVHPQAQAAAEAFIERLDALYGAFDVLVNRLFFSAFLRGAVLAELVLDDSGREPIDLATPDPYSVRFKRVNDPDRGQVWQMGQFQGSLWVPLDRETIQYIPVDPFPGKPYGRSLAWPALHSTLFLIGLLHDLKRVVQQQGYPRLDLAIDMEKLKEAMPEDLDSDPERVQSWVSDTITAISSYYNELEPDDAYVHLDLVTVNRPVGAVDSSSLGAVDGLIRAIERMSTRGLKSMPLLMGSNEAVAETHAKLQRKVYLQGVSSIQHLVETLLQRVFSLALQCQGLLARAEVRFAELDVSDELEEARTESQRIRNEKAKYDQGWTSQDEGAEEITGHAADQPEPRMSDDLALTDVMPATGRSGGTRSVRLERVAITPEGAEDPLPDLPDGVAVNDNEIEAALAEWNRSMEEYEDLLSAEVEGQEEFEDDIPSVVVGLWVWQQLRKRYRHSQTGETIGGRSLINLRDDFTRTQLEHAPQMTQGLRDGAQTVQQWELDFRKRLKSTYFDQYSLGKGGVNNLTNADLGRVGDMLNRQYDYLHNFAQEVKAGGLSQAQIQARSRLYFNSGTQAFEEGKAASYRMPSLPDYPASGSTPCRTNCKCYWRIEEDEEAWNCYWELVAVSENCDGCKDYASRWNPLVVPKVQATNRGQLMQHLWGRVVEAEGTHHHEARSQSGNEAAVSARTCGICGKPVGNADLTWHLVNGKYDGMSFIHDT